MFYLSQVTLIYIYIYSFFFILLSFVFLCLFFSPVCGSLVPCAAVEVVHHNNPSAIFIGPADCDHCKCNHMTRHPNLVMILNYHPHPDYRAPWIKYFEGSIRPIYMCSPRKYIIHPVSIISIFEFST